jgi:hypothetical protein
VNLGVIRHRSDCALDLAGQAPLIGTLLAKVKSSEPAAKQFRTLMWGRIYPDHAREATLAQRIAVAAKRAPDWNVATGQPRAGGREAWVARALEEGKLYEELRGVFQEQGLRLRVASVEKALVGEAANLPFFEELKAQGVGSKDKVPFDVSCGFGWARRRRGAETEGERTRGSAHLRAYVPGSGTHCCSETGVDPPLDVIGPVACSVGVLAGDFLSRSAAVMPCVAPSMTTKSLSLLAAIS